MTKRDILQMLESTGIPVVYHHWGEPQPLPYCVYLLPSSNNFAADGVVYHTSDNVRVELYTEKKDWDAESKIEQALNAHGLFWERDETYIESERAYMTIYEFEV